MPWFWFLLAGAVAGLIVLWLRRSARRLWRRRSVCQTGLRLFRRWKGPRWHPPAKRRARGTGTLLLYPLECLTESSKSQSSEKAFWECLKKRWPS